VNQIRRVDTGNDWPTRLMELSDPERLIAGAYRHWFTGVYMERSLHFEVVAREFRLSLGEALGTEAFAAFAALTRVLQRAARETIRFHMPCCPHLGAEEVQLVCLTAASQQGRFLLLRNLAELVVEPGSVGDFIGRVSELANVLERAGCILPQRVGAMPFESSGDVSAPRSAVH